MNLNAILAERLAILGGTGSGKSYAARGLAERVLDGGHRLGVIDPTGVWWGLRSEYQVVLFGGDHADLPLTENSGRIIAQAVAGSQQSWIIDTSALKSKAAERRFMLDFLDALFRENRAPITLVVDEADRFSPQRMSPDAARLHERMEEIVRRGRVRGFTPWLITQRPASLNKDVLSQATAMICMRMTGVHDRKAIAEVIKGQADETTAKEIVDAMPRHKIGQGLVWAPQQDILLPVSFPKIKTLDTMQPSVMGARKAAPLRPIDVGALKEKLATVETEEKANDPAKLRAENAKLKADLAKAVDIKVNSVPDQTQLKAEYDRGYVAGYEGGTKDTRDRMSGRNSDTRSRLKHLAGEMEALARALEEPVAIPKLQRVDTPHTARAARPQAAAPPVQQSPAPSPSRRGNGQEGDELPAALQRAVNAIGWWRQIGHDPVERNRAAVVAGYSPKASTFGVYIADLVKRGLVTVSPGKVALTPEGVALAVVPTGDTAEELRKVARALLSAQEQKIFDVVYAAHPNEIARSEIAERVGLSPVASTVGVYIAGVAAYGIIKAGSRGHVRAADWLFPT